VAVAGFVVLVGCSVPGFVLPEHEILRDVYVRGPADASGVALTFDDGPNGRCTEAVLDALRELGVPATFFVLGQNVAGGRNDRLLGRMVREGHEVGMHGETHRVRPLFRPELVDAELARTRAAISAALRRDGIADPPPVLLFRPPFGVVTDTTADAVRAAGLSIVEWTVSVGDWRRGRRADEVTDAILRRLRGGDVVVLHDGNGTAQRSAERCVDRPVAAGVVRALVPALGARGLHVAPLAELLGLRVPPSAGSDLTRRAGPF